MINSAANPPPVVLTIAGSDCSAGAGLQVDLKAFSACGVYGASAVTCVVAENGARVGTIDAMSPELVAEQIRIVLEELPVAAAKTGMLFSKAIIEAVAGALPSGLPLVIDPVMISSSGTPLLLPEAVEVLEKILFPRAALVTPNRREAERLLGASIDDLAGLKESAARLAGKYGVPFLVKGGHLPGEESIDAFCDGSGQRFFSERRVPNTDPRGTGCALSAAIAAHLAHGKPLPEAIEAGKAYMTRAIAERLRYGKSDLLSPFLK